MHCCIAPPKMNVARVLHPLQCLSGEKDAPSNSGQSTTMTEGLVTPLRSVLTCAGCGQRYNDTDRRPKFLVCFHTACLSCLSKGFSRGKVSCPTCSQVTESDSATSLADNIQLCTILLNMSSLNLHEPTSSGSPRDSCPTHLARINFWCETCRLPVCRDCTVLSHRQSAGHKVCDHDDATTKLKSEIRLAIADARTLQKETRRLRQDHRKYLLRQVDACKAFEKQIKAELKTIDNDKKEEYKELEKMESDINECTSLLSLHQAAEEAGKMRLEYAQQFTSAKAIVAEKVLTLGKLNRSTDDLDAVDEIKSSGSGSPSSPLHASERRVRSLAGRFLHHNGKAGRHASNMLRPAFSLEAPPIYIQPKPRVFLDFSIEGISHSCRVVCELWPDRSPTLCENFIRLCTGKRGFGYKNSKIFRCLPGWWIQGGDFETNDGEGGKSAMEEELIPAEPADLETRPGALEMLCVATNKKGLLMVGSQFFIHVKKYSYTHVFGYVIDGLELIEKISQFGDQEEVYHPNKEVYIVDSGLLKA